MGTLSKPEILKHLKAGNVVIDPFNEENFGNTSYEESVFWSSRGSPD